MNQKKPGGGFALPAYVVLDVLFYEFRKHPARGVNSIINVVHACVRPT